MPIITLKPSKPMPIPYIKIYNLLKEKFDDVEFRWSRRGVPHIIVATSIGDYSVCYFSKYGSYRVFFPYNSNGQEQIKWDSRSQSEVFWYIMSQVPRHRKLRSDGSVEEGDYSNAEEVETMFKQTVNKQIRSLESDIEEVK